MYQIMFSRYSSCNEKFTAGITILCQMSALYSTGTSRGLLEERFAIFPSLDPLEIRLPTSHFGEQVSFSARNHLHTALLKGVQTVARHLALLRVNSPSLARLPLCVSGLDC